MRFLLDASKQGLTAEKSPTELIQKCGPFLNVQQRRRKSDQHLMKWGQFFAITYAP